MSESKENPESGVTQDVLGGDLASVEEHLERRFSDADPDDIHEAIETAAGELADAKITTFRPLLVEHNASDALRREPKSQVADENGSPRLGGDDSLTVS